MRNGLLRWALSAAGLAFVCSLAMSGFGIAQLYTFSLTGDVTGTATGATGIAATTVGKINGSALGTTTPTAGNILVGSGTNWATQAVSGDATITSGGVVTNAKVDGVTYPASPSTNTVPVVTGTNAVTYEAVPNAALANSSLTLGSTALTLGTTTTTVAGLTCSACTLSGTTTAATVNATTLEVGGVTVAASNAHNFKPTNPTGTSSTSAFVMMGLGTTVTITPATSGKVLVIFSGTASNSTSGDGGALLIQYGTGTAPANGAALAGTQCGTAQTMTSPSAGGKEPFSLACILAVTPGTTYWLDVAAEAATGGTFTPFQINVSAAEL